MKGKGKRFLNVIIHWTDAEVWEFIRKYKVPYCKLYDEGWKRIGCLFCPMAVVRHKKIELAKYPRYEEAYRRAFRKLYERRKADGNPAVNRWKDGDEMFDWWIDGTGGVKENPDQQVLFE